MNNQAKQQRKREKKIKSEKKRARKQAHRSVRNKKVAKDRRETDKQLANMQGGDDDPTKEELVPDTIGYRILKLPFINRVWDFFLERKIQKTKEYIRSVQKEADKVHK